MHQHLTKALSLVLACTLALGQTAPLLAAPQDGKVVAGSAVIKQESATKVGITQTTDRVAIDWKSFSIGASEQVQFYQPSASSIALNRVTGVDPSVILGKLTANGQVFLVNPNGILFGKGSQVDVSGLMATTHNIKNENFMAGNHLFNIPGNPGASVINEGVIRIADTGVAAFVAPSVANRGIIAARLGKVALASANGFTLDLYGDNLLSFLVSDEVAKTAFDIQGNQLTSFVENSGRIEAQGGHVLLTAKAAEGVVHSVINQSGIIEATTVGQDKGEIVLSGGTHGVVSNTGTLDASGKGTGETGGRVLVTGETVNIEGNALVDVSGDVGGGTALIGGDHMGGLATAEQRVRFGLKMEATPVATATDTRVGQDVVIDASAIASGDGGKIVVWADDSTEFHGTARARGGAQGGDGGVVELSGGKRVVAGGKVDVSAPKGTAGRRLIDPAGSIYASVADFISEFDSGVTQFGSLVSANGADYIVSAKLINAGDIWYDPDSTPSRLHAVYVTKIVNGVIVAQSEIGQFHISANSAAYRSAITVIGNDVRVFFSGKSPSMFIAGGIFATYGQTACVYSLNKDTLDGSSSLSYQNMNWGWNPYYTPGGDLQFFSYAGYHRIINNVDVGYVDPNVFWPEMWASKLTQAGYVAADKMAASTFNALPSDMLAKLKGNIASAASRNAATDNKVIDYLVGLHFDIATGENTDGEVFNGPGTTSDPNSPGRPRNVPVPPPPPLTPEQKAAVAIVTDLFKESSQEFLKSIVKDIVSSNKANDGLFAVSSTSLRLKDFQNLAARLKLLDKATEAVGGVLKGAAINMALDIMEDIVRDLYNIPESGVMTTKQIFQDIAVKQARIAIEVALEGGTPLAIAKGEFGFLIDQSKLAYEAHEQLVRDSASAQTSAILLLGEVSRVYSEKINGPAANAKQMSALIAFDIATLTEPSTLYASFGIDGVTVDRTDKTGNTNVGAMFMLLAQAKQEQLSATDTRSYHTIQAAKDVARALDAYNSLSGIESTQFSEAFTAITRTLNINTDFWTAGQ